MIKKNLILILKIFITHLFSIYNYIFKSNSIIGIYNFFDYPVANNFSEFLLFLEIKRQENKKKNIIIYISDKNSLIAVKEKYKKGKVSSRFRVYSMILQSMKKFIAIKNFHYSDSFLLNLIKKGYLNVFVYELEKHQNYLFNNYNNLDQMPYDFEESDKYVFLDWVNHNKLNDNKIITLTLRFTKNLDYKNSIIDGWLQLYDYIKSKGFDPVFITDIDADQDFKIFDNRIVCDVASYSYVAKMSFYKESLLNIFITNGPPYNIFWMDVNYIHVDTYTEGTLTQESRIAPLSYKLFTTKKKFKSRIDKKQDFQTLKKEFDRFLVFNEENKLY